LPQNDTQCGFKEFLARPPRRSFGASRSTASPSTWKLCFLARKLDYTIVELPVTWCNGAHSSVRALRDSLNVILDVLSHSLERKSAGSTAESRHGSLR